MTTWVTPDYAAATAGVHLQLPSRGSNALSLSTSNHPKGIRSRSNRVGHTRNVIAWKNSRNSQTISIASTGQASITQAGPGQEKLQQNDIWSQPLRCPIYAPGASNLLGERNLLNTLRLHTFRRDGCWFRCRNRAVRRCCASRLKKPKANKRL